MITDMKRIIVISSVVFGLFFANACSGRLDVAPPNSITEEQVKDLINSEDPATRERIMTLMAAPMVKYFNFWGIQGQGTADPRYYEHQGLDWVRNIQGNDVALGYDSGVSSLAGKGEYDFSIPYTASTNTVAFWYGYAVGINQANALLGYLTKDVIATNDVFKDGRARALLVRAYSYMCLMENFQDAYTNGGADKLGMSLYTDYDPLQEPVARSSSKETYEFILNDINEAVSLLTDINKGYTAGRTNSEDIDLGVAYFVQARAALEYGDYATCIAACNAIIGSGKYGFIAEANYGGHNTGSDMTGANVEFLPETNAFTNLAANPECILGYYRLSTFKGSGYFTALANPFGSYAASGKVFARIDDQLYNKINDNDFRKGAFYTGEIGDYTNGASPAVTYKVPDWVNLKFAATHGLTDAGTGHTTKTLVANQDFCKFRLSEVVLMLAEAQLASGNESAAKTTLNTLLAARTKAGASPLTCDNYATGLSTKDLIQLQWRIEMWCEGGREYFNNKRWGIDVDRTNSNVHVTKNTRSWQKLTCELPDRELQDNPNTTPNGITGD